MAEMGARVPMVRGATTGEPSIEHNFRTDGYWAPNIDSSKTSENIIIKERRPDELKEIYDKIFGEAVKAYDEKQKRKDRRIGNYYEYLRKQNERNIDHPKKRIKLEREIVAQIGNMHQTGKDDQQVLKALETYARTFEHRNPNLIVTSAVIHLDEKAAPHLHLTYIPIAHNEKKLQLRNSYSAALEEMGYVWTKELSDLMKAQGKKRTAAQPQCQWTRAESNALFEIAEKLGIKDIEHEGTCSRDRLETPAYKRLMRSLDEELNNELREQQERQEILEGMAKQIKRGSEHIREQEERINKLNEKLNEIKENNKKTIKELDKELEEKQSQLRETNERLKNTMEAMDRFKDEAEMVEKIEELTKENEMFKTYLIHRNAMHDFEVWAEDYKNALETEQEEISYNYSYLDGYEL